MALLDVVLGTHQAKRSGQHGIEKSARYRLARGVELLLVEATPELSSGRRIPVVRMGIAESFAPAIEDPGPAERLLDTLPRGVLRVGSGPTDRPRPDVDERPDPMGLEEPKEGILRSSAVTDPVDPSRFRRVRHLGGI